MVRKGTRKGWDGSRKKSKIKRLRVGLEEGPRWEKASELGTTQVCLGLCGDQGRGREVPKC